MMDKVPETVGRVASLEIARRRKLRNWAVLAVLASLSVLFYAMTVVKFMNH
jgi:hypothetical protein